MGDVVGKVGMEKLLVLTTGKGANSPAAAYRNSLLGLFGELATSSDEMIGNPSMVAAATEAVIRSGVGSTAEAVQFVDRVWDLGLVTTGHDSGRSANAVAVLKGVKPDANVRATYDAYLAKKIRDFARRQETGMGSQVERRWLAQIGG